MASCVPVLVSSFLKHPRQVPASGPVHTLARGTLLHQTASQLFPNLLQVFAQLSLLFTKLCPAPTSIHTLKP